MTRVFIFFLSLINFVACATVHHSTSAQSISNTKDLDLYITAAVNKFYSDSTNLYFDFTLENRSSNWVHIDTIDLDFSNTEGIPHNVIVGKDIKAWAESTAIRKRKENFNADLGVAGMIIGGALMMVAAATSGRPGEALGFAGTGLYVGGATLAVSQEIKKANGTAAEAVQVPETYIYAPVTIPSNGFAQRWAIVNIPLKKVANKMRIRLHSVEGGQSIYEVPINGSEGLLAR